MSERFSRKDLYGRFQEWFPDRKWKPFVLTFLFSVVVTLISTWVSFRHDSWILKFTEHPRIGIEEVRFEKIDSYILAKETKKGIELTIRFRVTNYGGSTATVKIANIYSNATELITPFLSFNQNLPVSLSPSGSFVLAPQESRIIDAAVEIPVLNRWVITDTLNKIRDGKFEIPFAMELHYEGEPDLEFEEKIGISVRVTPTFVYWNYSVH